MTEKKALLLVGSPRGTDRSTSGRLGGRLLDVLEGEGFRTVKIGAHTAVQSPSELESALASIGTTDIVILSFPLYVDSLPAPLIALLERIAERRVGAGKVRVYVVVQCGFPEKEQNAVALAITRRFADEAGWTWLGGLALSGAETYGKGVGDALVPVGKAIAKGATIPEPAVRKLMPSWLYRLGGNVMWRRMAKGSGAARRLRDRPYTD